MQPLSQATLCTTCAVTFLRRARGSLGTRLVFMSCGDCLSTCTKLKFHRGECGFVN